MSERDAEQSRKLFLGGLSYETTEDGLTQYFGKFGKITDCVVMRFKDTKRSRGFGFVTFSSVEEADYCYKSGPHTLDGAKLETKKATPREDIDKEVRGNGEILRKLFVGSLNYDTTDEGLRTYFEQFGEVVDSVVMKFRDSNRSRGFGFVTYKQPEMVDTVQLNRPHRIDGVKVETKRAVPRDEANKGDSGSETVKKIFVGGLKDGIEDKDLEDYFGAFGRVISVEQMVERGTSKKRGFGFIEFDDYDPVDKIILQSQHFIGDWRLDIKKAVSRSAMGQVQGGGRGGGSFRGGREDRGGRSTSGGQAPWSNNQQQSSGFGGGNFGGNNYGNRGGENEYENTGGWSNNSSGGPGPWQGGGGVVGSSGNSWEDQGNDWSGGNNRFGGGGSNNSSGSFKGNAGGPMRSGPVSGGPSRSAPYPSRGGGGGGGYGDGGSAGGYGSGNQDYGSGNQGNYGGGNQGSYGVGNQGGYGGGNTAGGYARGGGASNVGSRW